ncbi:hypothetical protein AMEX_G25495 [Astyanax mexicanus]|uniref:Uncharacterized protein n=1 Tax=Astyanax mexicanus TaxID=7994 RepID=A0A8T2KRZ2_ASTMX|nr:hypothetical protein AMEX_G25495 [Astyanax mexicanus]
MMHREEPSHSTGRREKGGRRRRRRRRRKKSPHMLTLFSIDGLLTGTVIWLDVFKDLLCGGKGQQLLAAALLEY